jgi:hypothetical protein
MFQGRRFMGEACGRCGPECIAQAGSSWTLAAIASARNPRSMHPRPSIADKVRDAQSRGLAGLLLQRERERISSTVHGKIPDSRAKARLPGTQSEAWFYRR